MKYLWGVMELAAVAAGGFVMADAVQEDVCAAAVESMSEMVGISLVPKPSSVAMQDGYFVMTAHTTVVDPIEGDDATAKAVRFLTQSIQKDTGYVMPVAGAAEVATDVSTITFVKDESQAEEAYLLVVSPDCITVKASGYAGYLYGIQTLRQFVMLANPAVLESGSTQSELKVPCVTITDAPRYPWRGFMLDSARNFQSADSIKRYLDYLAFIKMNRFHWHLVDSQGWRIEIKRYPELTEKAAWRGTGEDREGGYYTQEQLREIVAYAKALNITIVPEIEMPAHSDCVLYTYPELSCNEEVVTDTKVVHIQHFLKRDAKNIGYFTQEQIDKGRNTRVGRNYCAGKEEVFEFLQNVLTEVMEIFDGPYIHVGGDERVANRWPKCPHCQARMEKHGLENDDQLQKYFVERIVRFLKENGRQGIMWAEHPEHGIPENVIVQAWRGKEAVIATKAGHNIINSLNPYRYLDYFEYEHLKGTHWLPGMSLKKAYEFDSYPEEMKSDPGKVIGTEAPLWTSWVEEYEVEECMFPRLLAVAEDGWYNGPDAKDFPEFKARVDQLEAPLGSLGVRYAKPLSEVPIKLRAPATVQTSMPQWKSFMPEYAFDRGLYHYFWSEKPPVKGDHFTIELKAARECSRVRVYSGVTNSDKHELRNAVLQVSADGVKFETVGEINGSRKFAAAFPQKRTVKAVRIRFVSDPDGGPFKKHEGTVVIRGIRID